MVLSENSRFRFTSDLDICRVLTGMWQVSGAHGPIDPHAAVQGMFPFADAGFTTWALADHYGPAEESVGEFRRRLGASRGEEALSRIQAFTKWVPRPGPMPRNVVEANIDRSLRRMDVETLGLLQFHWWDYRDARYLDSLGHLAALRDEGKIRHLALTNFDTQHLEHIADQGIEVVSNQVQYSIIDRRPEVRMAPYCADKGVHLLAYGALCGVLVSQRYLGRPQPGRGRAGHRQPDEIHADGRRLGRLGAVPGVAGGGEGHRRQARSEHRQRGRPLHPGPAGGGGSDPGRAPGG